MKPKPLPFHQVKEINHLPCNLYKKPEFAKAQFKRRKKPPFFTMTVVIPSHCGFQKSKVWHANPSS